MRQPPREALTAAENKTCRDVIGRNLGILFCGINPSLMTAAVGHHFARPGNRFWKTLAGARLTPRVLDPSEDLSLLDFGMGITNLVARATRTAAELSPQELAEGWHELQEKVKKYRPRKVVFLGIGAYRSACGDRKAVIGPQANRLSGASVWVLPNPSGLNAHYQLPDLIKIYGQLNNVDAPAAAIEEE